MKFGLEKNGYKDFRNIMKNFMHGNIVYMFKKAFSLKENAYKDFQKIIKDLGKLSQAQKDWLFDAIKTQKDILHKKLLELAERYEGDVIFPMSNIGSKIKFIVKKAVPIMQNVEEEICLAA